MSLSLSATATATPTRTSGSLAGSFIPGTLSGIGIRILGSRLSHALVAPGRVSLVPTLVIALIPALVILLVIALAWLLVRVATSLLLTAILLGTI